MCLIYLMYIGYLIHTKYVNHHTTDIHVIFSTPRPIHIKIPQDPPVFRLLFRLSPRQADTALDERGKEKLSDYRKQSFPTENAKSSGIPFLLPVPAHIISY